MKGGAGLRLDATIKHLTRLAKSGLLAPTPDPQDERRMLYRLAPSVSVVQTDTGRTIDFGCCVVVCSGKIQLAGVIAPALATAKD